MAKKFLDYNGLTTLVSKVNTQITAAVEAVSVPWADHSATTSFAREFSSKANLVVVPWFNTSNVTSFQGTFTSCYSLLFVPSWTFSNAWTMRSMCTDCWSLREAGVIDSKVCEVFDYAFYCCYSLRRVGGLDMTSATSTTSAFGDCKNLDELTITSWPTSSSVTLNFQGLTAWGTSEAGRKTMEASLRSLYYRIDSEAYGIGYTIRIPTATWQRLCEVWDTFANEIGVSDLETTLTSDCGCTIELT